MQIKFFVVALIAVFLTAGGCSKTEKPNSKSTSPTQTQPETSSQSQPDQTAPAPQPATSPPMRQPTQTPAQAPAQNANPALVGMVHGFMTQQLRIFIQQKGRMPSSFTEFTSARMDSVPRPPEGYQWAIDESTVEVKLVRQ